MIMKFHVRIFLVFFGFLLFFVAGSLIAKSAEAANATVIINIRNNGDYPDVDFSWIIRESSTIIRDANGNPIGATGTIVNSGHIPVGANAQTSKIYYDPSQNNAPYTVQWTAYKAAAANPDDQNCKDPILTAVYTGTGFNPEPGSGLYQADAFFACWIPQAPPPPPYSAPSNLSASPGCFGVTAVNFTWNLGTSRDIWLDVSESSSFSSWDNVHFTNGETSFTWSSVSRLSNNKEPAQGTRYYWRLYDGTGHVYPSPTSFVALNCLPELIATLNSVPDLTVGQSYNFSGAVHNQSSITAGSSHARFCVAPVGVNQDCLNSNRTPGGYVYMVGDAHSVNSLASQQQQNLTSFFWPVPNVPNGTQFTAWLCADVLKVVTEQIETNNCANRTFNVTSSSVVRAIPNPVPVPNCSDTTYPVTLSWQNSGSGWFVDISTRSDFATFSNKNVSNVTSTSAPSGFSPALTLQPNTTYYWRIFDGSPHAVGQPWSVPTCPPLDCTTGTTGVIMGSKWSVSDGKHFDTLNGLPGATVTISGTGVNNTFGPSINPYSKTVPAAAAPGTTYNVSSTGVPGWRVHAEIGGDGAANGVYAIQADGFGTAVNVPVVCGKTVSVWFYFERVPTPPPSKPSPCPPKGDLNGDLIVDQKDIDLFGSFYGQTSASALSVADLDGNGAINLRDVLMLGNYIGGAISTFPACSPTTQLPVTCSPPSQTVNIGQTANLSARRGNGTYSWVATGGSPASGSGANFSVSYSTSGTKTVTVTSGGTSANCSVSVGQPPTTGIRLSGSRSCPDPATVVFNLSWTTTTGDTQFNIVRNGVHITSLFGSSWSTEEPQSPSSVSFNVFGLQSSTLSNTVRLSANCAATPPPRSGPDIQGGGMRVSHLNGSPVTVSSPAVKGERLKAEFSYSENNNVRVASFNAAFFSKDWLTSVPDCNPLGPTATFTRLSTNFTTPIILTTEFDAPNADGVYTAWYFLDNDCRIRETSEVNNVNRRTYFVGQLPIDVSIDNVREPANKTFLSPGERTLFRYIVTNNSSVDVQVFVGFWKTGAPPPLPSCPTSASSPPTSATDTTSQVLTLGPFGSSGVGFEFVAPSSGSTAYAYAGWDCAINDSNWANNIASQTYTVGGGTSWFKTTGGDVGAKGIIKLGYMPAGEQFSTYVAASGGNLQNARGAWNLSTYAGQLTPPGSVYGFFETRFKNRAQANNTVNSDPCIISGGGNLVYCAHGARYDGASLALGSSVWFVNGDLTISRDLKIGASDTLVLIASGNITIETGVSQVDAVMIAGGKFSDCTQGCGGSSQLTVNGAVYANTVSFARVLPSANDTTPADIINFAPKYLDRAMSQLIGSPSIQWTEVAP